MKALTQDGGANAIACASRLFGALCLYAETPEGEPPVTMKRGGPLSLEECVFQVLVLARLKKGGPLGEVLQKVESNPKGEDCSAEEFKQVLNEAQILGVEEKVWRRRLEGQSGSLSNEALTELFGQSAAMRAPKVFVSESGYLSAITTALTEEFKEKTRMLKQVWDRNEAAQKQ